MERADSDKAAQDPKVKALIERWEVSYPIAKIQGVPAYVVNGKYLLMTKNITSIDSMADTIKELAAK
jgi:thiol:disulfide interchange protein DsbA